MAEQRQEGWRTVLETMRRVEQCMAQARRETPRGRGWRNYYRNSHPLDAPISRVRLRIADVARALGEVDA